MISLDRVPCACNLHNPAYTARRVQGIVKGVQSIVYVIGDQGVRSRSRDDVEKQSDKLRREST